MRKAFSFNGNDDGIDLETPAFMRRNLK
jgi:hypothetical protein